MRRKETVLKQDPRQIFGPAKKMLAAAALLVSSASAFAQDAVVQPTEPAPALIVDGSSPAEASPEPGLRWNDHSPIASTQQHNGGWLASAGAGMALCLGNPSTLLVYILLLPSIAPAGITGLEHMALVAVVTLAAVGAVFACTILLARQLNRIIVLPSSSSVLSRIAAATIALTSFWILAV